MGGFGVFWKPLTRGGEVVAPSGSENEYRPQLDLKRVELATDSTDSSPQRARGLGQTAGFDHANEGGHVVNQIH